jgi:hypothetical protein
MCVATDNAKLKPGQQGQCVCLQAHLVVSVDVGAGRHGGLLGHQCCANLHPRGAWRLGGLLCRLQTQGQEMWQGTRPTLEAMAGDDDSIVMNGRGEGECERQQRQHPCRWVIWGLCRVQVVKSSVRTCPQLANGAAVQEPRVCCCWWQMHNTCIMYALAEIERQG